MSIHNVDPDLVARLRDLGLTDLTADEIVAMSIHNVDAEFIETLRQVGAEKDWDNLSVDDLLARKLKSKEEG